MVLAVMHTQQAPGDVPQLINYQGRLVNGGVLVNQPVTMQLRLYDAPANGTLLYEDSNTVTVIDGLYSTYLGDGTVQGSLADALTNAAVYVEAVVDGVVLTPRDRLVSVAYALNGTVGPTGPIGADGNDGATGAAGADGAAGAQGNQGETGLTGDAGAAGADGAAGNDGAAGAQGTQGVAGADGNDGATGAAGADGADGATGAAGAQGIQGETGLAGADGVDGIETADFENRNLLGHWGVESNLTVGGVFSLADTVWDDMTFPANGFKLDVSSAVLDYDYDEVGIEFPNNASTGVVAESISAPVQFLHAWLEGSDIRPHVHWIQTAADQTNNWYMTHRWYNPGSDVTSWVQSAVGSNVFTYTSGSLHQISEFPVISGTGKTLSSLFDMRVERDGDNDTSSATLLFKQFDIHIQKNKLGSADEFSN